MTEAGYRPPSYRGYRPGKQGKPLPPRLPNIPPALARCGAPSSPPRPSPCWIDLWLWWPGWRITVRGRWVHFLGYLYFLLMDGVLYICISPGRTRPLPDLPLPPSHVDWSHTQGAGAAGAWGHHGGGASCFPLLLLPSLASCSCPISPRYAWSVSCTAQVFKV